MLRQKEKKRARSTSESLGTSKSGPNDKKERQGSRATRCRSVGNRVQCPYQSTSEVPRRCRKAFQIRPKSKTCALSKQKIGTRPSIREGKRKGGKSLKKKTQKDREDFSKLLGRRLKISTKSAPQGPAKFDTESFGSDIPLSHCLSVYLSIRLSVCLTATRTKRKKTKKRTWTTTIATACRFFPGNTEARNLIKLETRSDGRKEGRNQWRNKSPKKKPSHAIFCFFFPVVRQKSNIYIQRKPKKSLKRNRLSNHIKCPQNTHTPQIHQIGRAHV